ncbi:F510_1955 family glycosylhydrolase [Sporichthya polymorpha]|uniref:F510_1955 family glycosylhydrolase n=1 Tax=Sporichthya polymorpha TaxID=35751 RepID=UPI00048B5501|nr:hypothetical protein [Sporichthya polymorpha]
MFAAVGAVAALVAIGGTVVALSGDGDESTSGSSVEIVHVHGLGVDPLGGVLLAGTHHGLFRVPQGAQATRVGEQVQDFMGFTVAGPNHYLASGHPGPAQLGPESVGLIESTDGGRSWQSLSLEGKADFHALEARHGLVYGLNALTGDFMVSQDKRTWQTRGQLPIADFAVSPDDAEILLATTEQGLARSEDGGNTYTPVAAAPPLLLVSWAEDGTIVGAGQDGTLHASTDGARTWQRRGSLGSTPHALTATSGSDVFAAVDGAILASLDGGRTFAVRYRE